VNNRQRLQPTTNRCHAACTRNTSSRPLGSCPCTPCRSCCCCLQSSCADGCLCILLSVITIKCVPTCRLVEGSHLSAQLGAPAAAAPEAPQALVLHAPPPGCTWKPCTQTQDINGCKRGTLVGAAMYARTLLRNHLQRPAARRYLG
jgi:hypothetical protein